jgi:AcrR family transcriptional regulator
VATTVPRKSTRRASPTKTSHSGTAAFDNAADAPTLASTDSGATAAPLAGNIDTASDDKRLRHPAGGGYARGEETRLRIIGAAIAVFGERGFDGATTREIAQRAGVNPPALQYYFENKEGVYRACANHIASTSRERYEPMMVQVERALKAGVTEEEAIGMFCDLLDVLVEHLLNSTDYRSRHLFMARVQSGHAPEEGIDLIREKVSHPVSRTSAALLSRLSGLPADDATLRMKSLMLFGQVMIFHVARPMALYVMGWTDFDDDSVGAVKKMVRDQTTTTLRGWLTELRADRAKK